MPPSELIRDGVLDPELTALVWLLAEGGVPITVTGTVSDDSRSMVAGALLALVPDRAWVVLDLDTEPPTTDRLAAQLQGGVGLGLTLAAANLQGMLEAAVGPVGLPEDAVRRLGVVVVLVESAGRLRCAAVHYLRPAERDGQGHVQRRPPAVLAVWDDRNDDYEHYAWGITPELADRVGRAQADFEERQRDRARTLAGLTSRSASGHDWDAVIRDSLESEPPPVPAPSRESAEPSPSPRD